MITSEDMLIGYPDEIARIAEVSCVVDTFESVIDSVDSWLLRTPFDPTTIGFVPGMIVKLFRVGSLNAHMTIFVVEAVGSLGLVLRLPGQRVHVGRGPGAIFGSDPVKAKIVDFRPAIESAQSTVDSLPVSKIRTTDPCVSRAKAAVKRLCVIRLASGIENLKAVMGLKDRSIDELERQVIETLQSDLLPMLWRHVDGDSHWTRLVR